tara:strand:- start:154 stop:1224 length:1071 start_codon:yes stop_codon:yes gene_type:complete
VRVGITGGYGFIGYHTYYNLKFTTDWDVIRLDKDFYNDKRIKECDWIIHLAGVNRGDEDEMYKQNIDLTQLLLDSVKSGCNIIFSSSTHAESDTSYGLCKLECEQMIQTWCQQYGGKFYNLRIPNVFGPFCKPNYNSFVATFCDKISKGKDVNLIKDNNVNLIYVKDVVEQFKNCIRTGKYHFNSTQVKVSEVAKQLSHYKNDYFGEAKIPNLNNSFYRNLFNTFISYLNNDDRLLKTKLHTDDRGSLTELLRCNSSEGQLFFSTTNPNYVRGQHFHMTKFERFCVIKGNAKISMRKMGSDKIKDYIVSGDDIKLFDTPVMYTHNIENIGSGDMVAIFWVSKLLNENDVDTYWEDV